MAKTKWTSGVLCQDKNKDGGILFFGPPSLDRYGLWYSPDARLWSLERFERNYDLRDEHNKPCKPPRAGTAFEVDLEL